MADMQTVVIIGSSQTKALIQNGKTFAYTPRYSKLGSTN